MEELPLHPDDFFHIFQTFDKKYKEKEQQIRKIEDDFLHDVVSFISQRIERLENWQKAELYNFFGKNLDIGIYAYFISLRNHEEQEESFLQADPLEFEEFMRLSREETVYCFDKDKEFLKVFFSNLNVVIVTFSSIRWIKRGVMLRLNPMPILLNSEPAIIPQGHNNFFPLTLKNAIGYAILESLGR